MIYTIAKWFSKPFDMWMSDIMMGILCLVTVGLVIILICLAQWFFLGAGITIGSFAGLRYLAKQYVHRWNRPKKVNSANEN